MKLGDRLRELRRARKETLLIIAGSTGVSVSYLSDLERGRQIHRWTCWKNWRRTTVLR